MKRNIIMIISLILAFSCQGKLPNTIEKAYFFVTLRDNEVNIKIIEIETVLYVSTNDSKETFHVIGYAVWHERNGRIYKTHFLFNRQEVEQLCLEGDRRYRELGYELKKRWQKIYK